MILRECNSDNQLYEMRLKVEFVQNSVPKFIGDLQTEFVLGVSETLNYDLPQARDLDFSGNATVSVEERSDTLKYRFPDFLTLKTGDANDLWHYDPETQDFRQERYYSYSLTMAPGEQDSGRVFYFNIVVSESGATNLRRVYPCTITVTGPVAFFTEVSFSLEWIDLDG